MPVNIAQAGEQIGGFLGGLLNPVLGKTSTEEVTGLDESAKSTRRTTTIVIAVLAVVTVVIVGIVLLRSPKAS